MVWVDTKANPKSADLKTGPRPCLPTPNLALCVACRPVVAVETANVLRAHVGSPLCRHRFCYPTECFASDFPSVFTWW